MGCGGDREKGPPEHTQKWDFITLSDFRSTSVFTPLAYGWLWFMACVSVAVYGLDTFTAVNLLIFDKWSSTVQPALEFEYSRWIFAVCILLSWVLCVYEWARALRAIRRGGVAQSYMDPLAAILQSMRPQGWKRFLVFTELTKSRKGADYVALFVYFAFQGAIRVILAEGPRQSVNAMTLYAALKSDILGPTKDNHSAIVQFFLNIKALADENDRQAIILFSMLFTLVIWVFSAISLMAAAVLYLVFLWHYIPQRDGRLSIYCRRKIDKRLEKIVEHKVKAAIEEEERKKRKAERKIELKRQKTGEIPANDPTAPKLARQPTLPQLGQGVEAVKDEKPPGLPLTRQDTNTTTTTLPPHSSRPPTRNERQPSLPGTGLDTRPGMPSRSATQASGWSNASYASNAPLLANAGYAGESDPMPAFPPTVARQDSFDSLQRPMPPRTMSQSTSRTQRPLFPMSRVDTSKSAKPFSPISRDGSNYSRGPPRMPPLIRANTGFSEQDSVSAISPFGPPSRHNTGFSEPDPASAVSSRGDRPFGPPSRQNTGFGQPEPTPARSFGPPSRQNTSDSFPMTSMRQDSISSTHNPPPLAPMSRQPTFASLQSQQSFSQHTPALQTTTQSSSNRPLSPASAQKAISYSPDSYEMTPQPPRNTSAQPTNGAYVAFNPSRQPTATPGSQSEPRRNITVAGPPGAEDNYFGHVRTGTQRSVTAPIEQRNTVGYGDIFDDYDSGPSPRASNIAATPVSSSSGYSRGAAADGNRGHRQQGRF